jgi:glycogen synthase
MKVLMLGWEFPPFISGGLGTACYGLTKAMDQLGIEVTFVLPRIVDSEYTTHVKLLNAGYETSSAPLGFGSLKHVRFRTIQSPLQPYSTPEAYQRRIEKALRQKQRGHGSGICSIGGTDYGGDMYAEVHRYAAVAVELAADEQFDIVHAHDWMTYPAGIAVAAMSGKPLIVHVH